MGNEKVLYYVFITFTIVAFIIVIILSILLCVHDNNVKNNEKQIRVAICFYGLPRYYNSNEGNFSNIKQTIIDKYNADVFFHTYISNDNIYPVSPWSGSKTISMKPDNIENDLVELYKPKYYQIDPLQKFDTSKSYTKRANHPYIISSFPSMWNSVQKCSELKRKYEEENNFQYDWVIRMRLDHKMVNFPDLKKLDPNYYYTPTSDSFYDNISISSSKNFDINSDLFFHLQEVWEKAPNLNKDVKGPIRCEELLQYYIESRNIKWKKLDWKVELVRKW